MLNNRAKLSRRAITLVCLFALLAVACMAWMPAFSNTSYAKYVLSTTKNLNIVVHNPAIPSDYIDEAAAVQWMLGELTTTASVSTTGGNSATIKGYWANNRLTKGEVTHKNVNSDKDRTTLDGHGKNWGNPIAQHLRR